MHYPTHSLSGFMSVVNARIEKVACLGYRHPEDEWFRDDTIFRNPFSNETAFIKLSNGMSARFSENRRLGERCYEGFEKLLGTNGVFVEYSEGKGVWRTRHSTQEIPLTVEDMRDLLPPEVEAAYEKGSLEGESLYGSHQGSHPYLVHEFVDAIANNRTPAITVEDSAHWLAAGIMAHRSAMNDGEWMEVPTWKN